MSCRTPAKSSLPLLPCVHVWFPTRLSPPLLLQFLSTPKLAVPQNEQWTKAWNTDNRVHCNEGTWMKWNWGKKHAGPNIIKCYGVRVLTLSGDGKSSVRTLVRIANASSTHCKKRNFCHLQKYPPAATRREKLVVISCKYRYKNVCKIKKLDSSSVFLSRDIGRKRRGALQ